MILARGAKVLACHRRLFEEDHLRLFVGTVTDYEAGIAMVRGFTWLRDTTHGFQRKSDERTKILSISSGAVIVYELPMEVDIPELKVEQLGGHKVVLTDGRKFRIDLSEKHTPQP